MCSVQLARYRSSSLFFFQAEDGIRDLVRSRGLGDVYKRQAQENPADKKEVAPTQKASGIEEEDELYGLCGNPDLIDCDTWTRTIENLSLIHI